MATNTRVDEAWRGVDKAHEHGGAAAQGGLPWSTGERFHHDGREVGGVCFCSCPPVVWLLGHARA